MSKMGRRYFVLTSRATVRAPFPGPGTAHLLDNIVLDFVFVATILEHLAHANRATHTASKSSASLRRMNETPEVSEVRKGAGRLRGRKFEVEACAGKNIHSLKQSLGVHVVDELKAG